jgi:hypothetical protein
MLEQSRYTLFVLFKAIGVSRPMLSSDEDYALHDFVRC